MGYCWHVLTAHKPIAAVQMALFRHFLRLLLLLQEVLFVMVARLVEIDEKWKHGALQRAGLTGDEIAHLVSIPTV